MEIIITQWRLDSYLDLKAKMAFTQEEYEHDIRPDVRLLGTYPFHPKFSNSKFWSKYQDSDGIFITSGYKMKWHQMGEGKVQLRLPVYISKTAFLCEAYVKSNAQKEKRYLARFKTHLQLIRTGNFKQRGVLK
jgi:hypothetical protein